MIVVFSWVFSLMFYSVYQYDIGEQRRSCRDKNVKKENDHNHVEQPFRGTERGSDKNQTITGPEVKKYFHAHLS